jgi:glutaredoxin-related protein
MKTQSKQQIVNEALVDEAEVYDDEDLCEVLKKKEEERELVKSIQECEKFIRLRNQYFGQDGCRAHDRFGCPECSSYARGECPSTREEYGYSGWD